MLRYIIWTSLFFFLSLFFTGCLDIASSGVQAVYNHHRLQKNFKDQYLAMRVNHVLRFETESFKNSNIAIAVYNKEALIAGQVPHVWQKQRATALILKKVPDIKEVHNYLSIASPSSSLTKMSDSLITGKVKSKLILSNDVDATELKVVTENGVVYLMGILTPESANAAVDIAENTDGVLHVVRLFSYIKISKTA